MVHNLHQDAKVVNIGFRGKTHHHHGRKPTQKKSDVYSFGILVLEAILYKAALEPAPHFTNNTSVTHTHKLLTTTTIADSASNCRHTLLQRLKEIAKDYKHT
jgi:hypothetical protein